MALRGIRENAGRCSDHEGDTLWGFRLLWSKKYLRIYHSRGLVDDDVVIEHYEAWKKQLIYVVYSETNVLTGKTVKKFILSPKRGTPKYSRRVMGKFRKAFNFGRHLKYFEHNTSDKFVYGSILHVVLEFDSNRFEKADCWNGIGAVSYTHLTLPTILLV